MKTVLVNTSNPYEILIEGGLLSRVGQEMAQRFPLCKVAIVTDSTVLPLYGEVVKDSLEEAGFVTTMFSFPSGEAQKNMATFGEILEFLATEEITKTDRILALGGGVVGDMAGFGAAVYQRGIPFVQVPTTFLAAVDSSVGGKTAIDLRGGKNMAGAFHQPSLVLCDTTVFSTLPDDVFAEGIAETLKYGVIGNEALFAQVEQGFPKEALDEIIEACVSMKRDIVVKDEFDQGERQLLNLGHTLGHAIEKCSHYTISHGNAVAIGLHLIARVAEGRGIAKEGTAKRICQALENNHLPTETIFPTKAIAQGAGMDKKRRGGQITFVFPESIGKCRLEKVEVSTLEDLVEEAMKSR